MYAYFTLTFQSLQVLEKNHLKIEMCASQMMEINKDGYLHEKTKLSF